ncbi:unnamed protein product [Adineta ricciae]|uniref:EGF-like domain-containing protein n=1 Tax=Adineta ricciae TaxID=249248 RepID=A0A815PL67_ADIRI|nr:unnamed protein product [Adineta ricciae]
MNSTLFYYCQNSTKCISKHRLMDGIQDCILNDDETISYSCELDDQHFRFQCTNSVELNQENIPFTTLCDGFIDLIDPENDETDENHYYWWQCNNIYTRCNDVWNYQNGADELNCSYLPIKCPGMQHPCVSLHTSKSGCLPIEMAGNNHIDCIGGTDERYLCHSNGQLIFKPFSCWNETKCLDIYDICDGEANCRYDDDEKFCSQNPSWISEYVCMPSENYQQTLEERIICLISLEQFRQVNIFFAFEPTIILSKPIRKNLIEKIQQKMISSSNKYSLEKISSKNHFHCNRGRIFKDSFGQLKCLCPPAYYGYSCQYQNQRVSLTVQIRPEFDWHTVFLLVIFLIDENQEIESGRICTVKLTR